MRNKIFSKYFSIIGDVIIDKYRVLKPKKLSPEAPVIIFSQEHEEERWGGAANVANNLIAMGADPYKVTLFSIVGEDWNNLTRDIDRKFGVNLQFGKSKTMVKERIVSKMQQICRIDSNKESISPEQYSLFSKEVCEICKKQTNNKEKTDIVIFSDYDHGVMDFTATRQIIDSLSENKIPMVVDSKAKDTVKKYRGCTIALPNDTEARDMTGLYEFDDLDIAKYLLKNMKLEAIGLTLGPRGILYLDAEGDKIYPSFSRNEEVVDVTGAGDTVTAAVAVAKAVDMSNEHMMQFANIAAGIVVQKSGVATASIEEISKVSPTFYNEIEKILEK